LDFLQLQGQRFEDERSQEGFLFSRETVLLVLRVSVLLFPNVFVPELFASKQRGVDDLRRAGVERCGRVVGRIELGFQIVVKIEEFFAEAALGFKGFVIRGFGGAFCCSHRIFIGGVFLIYFLDASSRRSFLGLHFKAAEEASLFRDADENVIWNAN
jgi:hypothetical protein